MKSMTHCPACGGRGIGKIGIGQYYCQDCCVEFAVKGNQVKLYTVQDDGSVLQYQSAPEEIAAKIS